MEVLKWNVLISIVIVGKKIAQKDRSHAMDIQESPKLYWKIAKQAQRRAAVEIVARKPIKHFIYSMNN